MAFFSKLRDRLFKSQAKLDEGLDALVEDGGEVEEIAEESSVPPPPTPEPTAPDPVAPPAVAPTPTAAPAAPAPVVSREPASVPPPAPEPEPAPAIAPPPMATSITSPQATIEPAEDSAEEVTRPGLLARAFGAKPRKTRLLDDEMLESLEEVLIQADMGVETSLQLSARLSEKHYGKRV
ncbi:MAG: signal recognition particle receptor subunit alpha, partial [Pseudomonadota bacterium]